jgi:hypothetical protein
MYSNRSYNYMANKESTHKSRKRLLTSKQEKYFRLLCQGVPSGQAAIKAGYSSKCAASSGHQAYKSIRARVQHALFEAGLTPEGLIHKHLLPALTAMEVEFAKSEGRITDSREVIAWGTRLRAIEIVCEIGGYCERSPRVGESGDDGPILDMPKVIDATIVQKKTF